MNQSSRQVKLAITICHGSVTQSRLTLCDPMDCSMPGFPVLHHLLELTQSHVHQVGDDIQLSHPLSSPLSLAINLSQHQSQLFTSGGQSIGVSVSSSFLPMNIQDWLSLGLTGLISWQSKGLYQIPYDYTVEITIKFSGLDLIERVPEELWTEVCDTVQEVVIKTIPQKKKCKKAK